MADRLTLLFDKHLQGQLTGEERVELMGLFLEPGVQPELQVLVRDAWNRTGEEEDVTETRQQEILEAVFSKDRIPADEDGGEVAATPVIDIRPPRRAGWKFRAAAASVILVASLAAYLWWPGKQDALPSVEVVATDMAAPQINRASITLANGQRIFLDSAGSGALATQGNVQVMKLADGQISYQLGAGSRESAEMVYNTLTNPRGSKVIDMTLADGSRVWLNAASSVTYPVAFAGNERNLTITGEAYFEVAHDAARPFYVTNGNMQVQVLGTHFNVNAYDDEGDIKVTLLEGRVKVSNNGQPVVLKPGEQANITGDLKPKTDNQVDIAQVMAWKEGWFEFEQTELPVILRQVSRWYDLQIVYEGRIAREKFGGRVSRELPLSGVLKMMESNEVTFKLEGKILKVTAP